MSDFDLTPLRHTLKKLAPSGRTALLPALHTAHNLYGFISEETAEEIGKALKVPLADIYGVIEFYCMFYTQHPGKKIIKVCTDPSCAMSGGEDLLLSICHHLNLPLNTTGKDHKHRVERATCLGFCDQAPIVHAGSKVIVRADKTPVEKICDGTGFTQDGFVGGDVRRISKNCNKGYPVSIIDYRSDGGYSALKTALGMSPQEIIRNVKSCGLVGRGGAAFPTGIKWESASTAKGEPKFIICNADESEPGTFKDRILMEENPHLIIEGMVIAAYAIGAAQGYIYVRGEYQNAYNILFHALEEARAEKLLGKDIMDTGFNFDVDMRQGAGAYICGEETALFESIEGKRGFPRIKPPFPTTHGLFNKPTLINNVETLCNIPFIIQEGAQAFRQLGTQESPGSKLFCISGDINRPGLYEAAFGLTLRDLVYGHAGGIPGDRNLSALLLGGAAGVFVPPEKLDLKLSFEDLNRAGIPLGSGAVIVFDDGRDMADVLLGIARFFAHESCGKCYPCQLGTQRQYEILYKASSERISASDFEHLFNVGWTMKDTSICGLGQTAASAVLSALELWPDILITKKI